MCLPRWSGRTCRGREEKRSSLRAACARNPKAPRRRRLALGHLPAACPGHRHLGTPKRERRKVTVTLLSAFLLRGDDEGVGFVDEFEAGELGGVAEDFPDGDVGEVQGDFGGARLGWGVEDDVETLQRRRSIF